MADERPDGTNAPVEARTFRTVNGRCTVAGGEVRIESGALARARRYLEGGVRPLAALAAVLALCTLLLLSGDGTNRLIAGAIVGLGVLRFVRAGLAAEGAVSIPMGTVERVEADPGGWGRNATLNVHHQRGGQTRVRTVTLPPGWYAYADEAYETAVEAFRARGVPVQEGDGVDDGAAVGARS